jgi:hypothetical protein
LGARLYERERQAMSVNAEINPLITYRDSNEGLIEYLTESLGYKITPREFAIFVEYFNDQVIGYAENLISELANDPEIWLEDYEVTE